MEPIQHALCNDVLRRPPGTTPEECNDLPILRAGGGGTVVSFWKACSSEIEAMRNGSAIMLTIEAPTHPPLRLEVLKDPSFPPVPDQGEGQEAADHVKAIVESYISACFPGPLPPRQVIELKLAFYAGMAAAMGEVAKATRLDDDSAVDRLLRLEVAVHERAQRLNFERTL